MLNYQKAKQRALDPKNRITLIAANLGGFFIKDDDEEEYFLPPMLVYHIISP